MEEEEHGSKFGAKTKKNLLTPREREKLLSSIRNFRESLAVYGLMYTGMRISEFLHMKRSWVDFKGEWIRIPAEQECSCPDCKRDKDGVWKVKVPEAERRIKLLPGVKPILRKFFDEYGDQIMDMLKDRRRAWQIVKSVAKRADISHRVFPHALRGTFASILAGKEFTVYTIKAMLGWKSFKTADEYIELSPDRQEKEIEKKW